LALLIFASMPMIQTLAGWAYNDLALAFYQLAGLYALINYLLRLGDQASGAGQDKDQWGATGWLLLAALFTGLAMGLKYTSVVMPVALGLLLIIFSVRRGRWGPGLVDLLIFGAIAGLVALPWYLKNWWITGNPVYPFLYGWFGGEFWNQFRADWYAAAGSGVGWDADTLLLLPWLATLGIYDANYWDGRMGPLFLLFLPLLILFALWGRRGRSPTWRVTYYSLGGYALMLAGFWAVGIIWSQSLWQSRLLLPALVILSPLVGWVWTSLDQFELPQFSIGRFVTLAVGLTLTLTLVDIGLLTLKTDPLPYLFGQESRDQYLLRRLGAHYAVMQEINQQLPPDAVIQFLWEPRTYYCERDCRPDNVLDVLVNAAHIHGTAGGIARAWDQAGITHVLIHRSGLQFVRNETAEAVDEALLAEFEAEHLQELIDVAGAYQVYELR
jgi:4-amino-4-deoxy-L-arabinose transferase-like glycosyltransferase